MLIFGIDKFMPECRALVNFIGNAVATLLVGKWDKAIDSDRVRKVLNRQTCLTYPTRSTPPRPALNRKHPTRRRLHPRLAPPRARRTGTRIQVSTVAKELADKSAGTAATPTPATATATPDCCSAAAPYPAPITS